MFISIAWYTYVKMNEIFSDDKIIRHLVVDLKGSKIASIYLVHFYQYFKIF